MPENNFDHSRVSKLVPKWEKFISMLEDYVEKQRFGLNELHLTSWRCLIQFLWTRGSYLLKIFCTLPKNFLNCGLVLWWNGSVYKRNMFKFMQVSARQLAKKAMEVTRSWQQLSVAVTIMTFILSKYLVMAVQEGSDENM